MEPMAPPDGQGTRRKYGPPGVIAPACRLGAFTLSRDHQRAHAANALAKPEAGHEKAGANNSAGQIRQPITPLRTMR
jgi:hypothetical protein